MKTIKLTSLIFLALAATLMLPDASAAQRQKKDRKEFDLKRHEFTVSTGIGPGRYYNGGYNFESQTSSSYQYNYENNRVANAYLNEYARTRQYTSGVWAAGYTYNFTKILSIQAHAYFEMGWKEVHSTKTGARTSYDDDIYVSLMPSFKVHWLNRNWIRMYSYVGLGLSVNKHSLEGQEHGQTVISLINNFQLTPLGLTVGKKFYGMAEIGVGTYYSGIAFGLGYRF